MVDLVKFTLMNIVSSLGLISDIIGGLLLFKFGLPSKLKENGGIIPLEEKPEDEAIRLAYNVKIRQGATIGLVLLIIGFILQLIGTNLSMVCNNCHIPQP
jgi:hypothetical protein